MSKRMMLVGSRPMVMTGVSKRSFRSSWDSAWMRSSIAKSEFERCEVVVARAREGHRVARGIMLDEVVLDPCVHCRVEDLRPRIRPIPDIGLLEVRRTR